MPQFDMTILYVTNPLASATFYANLLGDQPVEKSPGFAMFVLPNGSRLGLLKHSEVKPEVGAGGERGELCFTVEDADAVRATHADWSKRMTIAQAPIQLDFGNTFVALDADGHRLRVFSPSLR